MTTAQRPANTGTRRRLKLSLCIIIFLLALVVRLFHWQDNTSPPFHGMTSEYKAHAMTLVNGDYKMFLSGPNPPSDANFIKHPPGYPLLMALVFKLFGDSENKLELLHVLLDSVCAVLVFLLASEMFSLHVGLIAGILVALSPQLAYHSLALLPDPLAAPPLLLTALFLWRAYKNPRLITIVAASVFVAVSCWFRSNALLLPFFFAALTPILFKRGLRFRFAAATVVVSIVLILPVTIRNAVYFRAFIPLSLSAGITLVEGIGVNDPERKFGLPDTDYGVTKWEAKELNRPDYLGTRFTPDGVVRERFRVQQGLSVVQHHPFWFLGVMAERATFMLRLARVELIRPQPGITNSLNASANAAPTFTVPTMKFTTSEMFSATAMSNAADTLHIEGSGSVVLMSEPIGVQPNTDYLLRLPIRIEQGSVIVEVFNAANNQVLARTSVIHLVNWLEYTSDMQPFVTNVTTFTSGRANQIRVRILNGSRKQAPVVAELKTVEGVALGPSSFTWTRLPRTVFTFVQRLFITAVMLPFTLLGVFVLVRTRRWPELAILLVVPVYYLCVQSALWTEFRYILTMHYFMFILTAVGFVWMAQKLWSLLTRARRS